MKFILASGTALLLFGIFHQVFALPAAQFNPNAEYELINVHNLTQAAEATTTTTTTTTTVRPPIVINTPPPVDPNSKSFVYNPKTKQWRVIKKSDPPAEEDALIWNQSNDKWLTSIARV